MEKYLKEQIKCRKNLFMIMSSVWKIKSPYFRCLIKKKHKWKYLKGDRF